MFQNTSNENKALAHNQLAEQYYKQKKFDIAISECQKAININPDLFNPYWIYGAILAERGQKTDAEELLKKALKLNPSNPGVHNSLGALLAANTSSIDIAINYYLNAIELDNRFWKAHYNLSLVYQAKGEVKKALDEGYESWKIHPSPMTLNNLLITIVIAHPRFMGGILVLFFLMPFLIRERFSVVFTLILFVYFFLMINLEFKMKNTKKVILNITVVVGILILHLNFLF